MKERDENKELIQRMAEMLRNHTEPYKEGAWERFSAAQGIIPRKRVLWPYWSAAAVLLVTAALFWFYPKTDTSSIAGLDTEKQLSIPKPSPPEQVNTPEPSGKASELSDKMEESPRLALDQKHLRTRVSAAAQRANTVIDDTIHTDSGSTVAHLVSVQADPSPRDTSAERNNHEENGENRGATTLPEQRLAAVGHESPGISGVTQGTEKAFAGEAASDDAARKWDLGIAVTPSMTSEKLNLGGGIAVAYRLSDKFSVGSGISVGRLGMGENPNYRPSAGDPPQYDMPPVGFQGLAKNREQYKRDVSLTSNVVALDIPLDLRYEVFNGFYTSVGVSYVAVLSEQRTEHFIGGLNENTFGSDNLTASTTVGYMSEKTADQPLRGKGYTGFMNFSIGRKTYLSKHIFFSIEPYFKLPIGQLAKEQMDFTNGGLRIVTGF